MPAIALAAIAAPSPVRAALYSTRRNRRGRAPYTASDAAWWADQTRDDAAPTDGECADRLAFGTLSPLQHFALVAAVRRWSSVERRQDDYFGPDEYTSAALASEGF